MTRIKQARTNEGRRPVLAVGRSAAYDPGCTRCPRLAEFLAEVHASYPDYWARPVPSFGAANPRIVLIGLAPGLHGANRTGRPFTGDYAGELLYRTLYEAGLATRPESLAADDRLELKQARIINAVKCVPPANKPLPDEIRECNGYLRAELAVLKGVRVVLALGRVGHEAFLRASDLKRSHFPFGHGREHRLDETRHLIDSYHCSRYNTSTGVLTEPMFRQVVARARELAGIG
ncbi:MAG TPA: uracil-DNA glycosylase [Steroidobacteraceae bacterium]|nr:uracil-DNA glycosylase [Steroidobacteraceae bacterium]